MATPIASLRDVIRQATDPKSERGERISYAEARAIDAGALAELQQIFPLSCSAFSIEPGGPHLDTVRFFQLVTSGPRTARQDWQAASTVSQLYDIATMYASLVAKAGMTVDQAVDQIRRLDDPRPREALVFELRQKIVERSSKLIADRDLVTSQEWIAKFTASAQIGCSSGSPCPPAPASPRR